MLVDVIHVKLMVFDFIHFTVIHGIIIYNAQKIQQTLLNFVKGALYIFQENWGRKVKLEVICHHLVMICTFLHLKSIYLLFTLEIEIQQTTNKIIGTILIKFAFI